MRASTHSRARGRFALWFVVALLGILAAAPSAFGQAAVDQYVPDARPGGNPEHQRVDPTGSVSSGGESLDAKGAGLPVAGKTSSGSSGGGDIPGTSYPITPFVAVLLGLMCLGLAARFALPALQRRLGGG